MMLGPLGIVPSFVLSLMVNIPVRPSGGATSMPRVNSFPWSKHATSKGKKLKRTSEVRRRGAIVLVSTAIVLLSGCASGLTGTEAQVAGGGPEAEAVTVDDMWVGAADSGDMTAGFGTIRNASDSPVAIESIDSEAVPVMELHETVDDGSGRMVMRETTHGFEIPADGHLHLEPGGNHFMLMELPEPLLAGDDVHFTLNFSDGSTLEVSAAVRDHAAGHEHYERGAH